MEANVLTVFDMVEDLNPWRGMWWAMEAERIVEAAS